MPRDPSIQIIPTLGPKVCKYYLHWAIWIPRVYIYIHLKRKVFWAKRLPKYKALPNKAFVKIRMETTIMGYIRIIGV